MEFDPASGGMKCRFCGHTEALPAPSTAAATALQPHSLDEFMAKGGTAGLVSIGAKALEITCTGCGAAVVFEPPQVAGKCSFCGADLVAQPKAADPLIAPDAVLPAKIPKEKAQGEVRQWLQTRWFAPNALKRMARQEGIGGVYLPFWDYDASTVSRYRGERGQHYWETEVYEEDDGRGGRVQRTRQVQRTAWYPAAGEVSRQFENVLIAASTSIAEARLNALEPWDIEALCPYEPAYLSGFKAQRYQVELPAGFENAKRVMQRTIEQDVRRDIGGDEQNIGSIDTEYSAVMFRHVLLPVWIGAYRFQNRAYQVVVNARTGEVQGERPFSSAKIAILIAAILVIIGLLIYLAKSR
jgi:ribosomal protein S27E